MNTDQNNNVINAMKTVLITAGLMLFILMFVKDVMAASPCIDGQPSACDDTCEYVNHNQSNEMEAFDINKADCYGTGDVNNTQNNHIAWQHSKWSYDYFVFRWDWFEERYFPQCCYIIPGVPNLNCNLETLQANPNIRNIQCTVSDCCFEVKYGDAMWYGHPIALQRSNGEAQQFYDNGRPRQDTQYGVRANQQAEWPKYCDTRIAENGIVTIPAVGGSPDPDKNPPGTFALEKQIDYCDGSESTRVDTIKWSASPDAEYYQVYMTWPGAGWNWIGSTGGTIFYNTNQSCDNERTYSVVAFNDYGSQNCKEAITFGAKPGAFDVTKGSGVCDMNANTRTNHISWSSSERADEYKTYVTSVGQGWTLISSQTPADGLAVTHPNQSCDVNQDYSVVAFNIYGARNSSNAVSFNPNSLLEGLFIGRQINFDDERIYNIGQDMNVINNPPPGFADLVKPSSSEKAP